MTPRIASSSSYINVRKLKFNKSTKSEWQGDLWPCQLPDWCLVLHHPDKHLKFTSSGVVRSNKLFLHCCHLVHPLTILFEYSADGLFRHAKCDAALPASHIGNIVEFVDLDLDLIVQSNFTYHLQDEDQFAENSRHMDYPKEVVNIARHSIALAESLVNSRQFPFDQHLIPRLELS